MSQSPSLPGSPGGPLQPSSPERVNQQRESIFSHLRREARDSSVHDKISQFNNLSVSMQSKQLERKTADAALKRAMLGREEAETEMRRYKEEVKGLRKSIEEGKERERRVGERLETLMVSCTERSSCQVMLTYLGKLWTRQGDACPYTSSLGKGDSTSPKRNVQDTIHHCQATRRTQVGAGHGQDQRREVSKRKGAQQSPRTRSLHGALSDRRRSGAARAGPRAHQGGGTGARRL